MNNSHSPISPWYARSPRRSLAVVVSLSLATFAAVMANEFASPARPDGPPVASSVSYLDQVGVVLANEYSSLAPPPAPSVTHVTPSVSYRDPSVPDASLVLAPGAADEPTPSTF